MEENDAIDGLKQLGLSTYEARVFFGLQKIGQGSANEISDVVDVPRSQVYGAADELEQRGLVETQQSTPAVYRPVPVDQARKLLLDQLAATGADTFEYLEQIQNTHEQETRSEAIWLLNSSEAIRSRAIELIGNAEERVIYGPDSRAFLEDEILGALAVAGEAVSVTLTTADETVFEDVPEDSQIRQYRVPEQRQMDVSTGRLLIVDDQTLLLSTCGDTGESEEVAFWTSENIFAAVLIELSEEWLQIPF